MPSLTRRELLAAGAASGAALVLRALVPRTLAAAVTSAAPSYAGVEDVWRSAWRWDRVVRGTHLRANCFSACAWNVFVKDGVVWREEQADVYARDGSELPDFAPRGCQKGACYSDLMQAPGRLLHPLERVGPRGSGQWRRISWEDALTRVADAILDANAAGGPETVVYDNGTSNVDAGPGLTGEVRLFSLLGATLLDGFGGTGDLAMGAVQSWGTSFVDGSADDWTRADALLFWHCNPAVTRIPDAHFASEARYRGATVVTIAPDYSPSAIHASLWVNPRPGSDAALALGIAHALLDRDAIDTAYLREQTDLPFLVREDTHRFLRGSDLAEGGSDERFYVWDEIGGAVAEAPGTRGSGGSLSLDALRPSLGGRRTVATHTGDVTVVPVLDLLRERLAAYDPASVERITGVAPGVQARLADLFARSPRTLIYASWGSNKSYHADLLQRALILLSALRGQQGRTGSGVRFAAWLPFDGADALLPGSGPSWIQKQVMRFYTPPPRAMEDAIAKATRTGLRWTPSHLFLHTHAGLDAVQDPIADAADPTLPRPAHEYLREALATGTASVRPAPDRPPRVLVTSGVNPLRRWPLPQVVERVLWPKLDLIVAIDFRLSTTGAKSDLLLPAAGYYEKRGIKYAVALAPYAVIGDQAVGPLGEARNEWEICARLAQRIQQRAQERGVEGSLAELADRFTEDGAFGPDDDKVVIDRILRDSPLTATSWEEARRAGAIPIRTAGRWSTTSGIGSEIEPGGTLSPSRVHVEGKLPWPTLTGRQQLYLDHPWFLEADEALPRWKPLPAPSGTHPIRLGGGHTRWSIHAIWRSHPMLLRLQRGGPVLWMALEDARDRAITDGMRVRVSNGEGSFRAQAKLSPALPPAHAILYHAWEPYQFPEWQGNMEVVASPYKALHFAGNYGHLRPRVFLAGPVQAPRSVAVEIERDPGS